MRAAVAALAVVATACCFDVGSTDACLERGGGGATCRPVRAYVCWSCGADEDAQYSPSSDDCTGELHAETTCAELGYTAACAGGDYFVLPGAGC